MDKKQPYIAIDLGTTNTVLSYGKSYINGFFGAEVVRIPQYDNNRNMQSEELLPSVFFIDYDGEIYVGKLAKWMRSQQSSRVIYNSKRFMGTEINWEIDGNVIRPKDVACEILKKCKNAAERALMRPEITGAVITVPASFNTDQIRDTIEAAVMAGFDKDNIQILSEPTAALIDFINDQSMLVPEERMIDFSTTKRIMVFDIGGGTCDVSIIDVKQNDKNISFNEKAVGRYDELGGVDFDSRAANYLLNKFFNDYKIDPGSVEKDNLKEMVNNLIIFCENAKEFISSEIKMKTDYGIIDDFDQIEFSLNIPNFYNGQMYSFTMTKREFDEATKNLYYKSNKIINHQKELMKYKNIEDPILNTLKDYGTPIESIDYVFLTGGMSQYIEVKNRVKEITGKQIIFSQRPLEAVARGAAIYHYYSIEISKENELAKLDDCVSADIEEGMGTSISTNSVLAEAIMIDVNEGLPKVIIHANQEVPYHDVIKREFKVSSPTGIKIDIYAGKDEFDSGMRIQRSYTGKFDYPVKTGTPIDIEYNIDHNKYLTMRVIVNDALRQRVEIGVESDILFSNGRRSE